MPRQVRRELGQIIKVAGLGEQWTPPELRHSFVSILSASDVPLEDISQLVGMVLLPSPRRCTGTRSGLR